MDRNNKIGRDFSSSDYLNGACTLHYWMSQAEFQGKMDIANMYRRMLHDIINKYDQCKREEETLKKAA